MGCTAIGSSFIGIGRDHWLEMLDNPRRPVAQWYPLMDSIPGDMALTTADKISMSFSCINSGFVLIIPCLFPVIKSLFLVDFAMYERLK